MYRKIVTSIIVVLFAFAFSNYLFKALAHTSGVSLEKEVNGFIVDVGIDQEEITSQKPVVLDFALVNKAANSEEDFDSVWITLKKEDTTYYAAGISKSKLGRTTVMLTFPQEGNYNLSTRFMKNDFAHTQATFPVTVIAPGENKGYFDLIYFIIAIIGFSLGLIAMLCLKSLKKQK